MKLTISLSADVRDTVISALKKTQLIVTPHKSNPNGVVLRAKGAGSSHVLTVSDVGGGTVLRAAGRSIKLSNLRAATIVAATRKCFYMARGVNPEFSRALTSAKAGVTK